jgi:LPXTG-motif cell wall-anchored protein
MIKRFVAVAAALAAMFSAVWPQVAQGQPTAVVVYAITANNGLLRFSSNAPGTINATTPITGLQSGEQVIGIDFRPANGQLYAVGSTGRLYTVNPQSGAATQSGSATLSLDGSTFGVDFNPVPDRLRVVSEAEQNLRINVDTVEATVDGALAYATGDANAGANPNVVAAAYTNNMAGATATQLFVIDSNRDILALQNPPNEGVLNTVGPLGINTSEVAGFDIAPGSGMAYAALTPSGASSSTLYTVDLNTGRATEVGTIGGGQPVRGLTVSFTETPAAAPAAKPGAAAQPTPAAPPAQMPAALPRTGEAESWAIGGLAVAGAGLLAAGLAARRRRRA